MADAHGLFDHAASQQNFLTGQTWGSAPPAAPSGWLGRYLDRLAPAARPGVAERNRALRQQGIALGGALQAISDGYRVAEAIDAFYADLIGHGLASRVLVLVFSEFGRRAEENSDLGTDHGFAAPLLAIGDPVTGGIYGD